MNLIILKSFFKDKKCLFWILITGIISGIIITTYFTIQKTNYQNEINSAKKEYGSYIYAINGVNVKDEKQILEITDCDYKKVFVDYKNNEDNEFKYYYANEEWLNCLGYRVIDGRYPVEKNEVLIPQWYMFYLDIPLDKVIGYKLQLENSITNKLEEYVISGISNENEKIVSIYFEEEVCDKKRIADYIFFTNRLSNIEADYENILKKMENLRWDDSKLNYEILWELGKLDCLKMKVFQVKIFKIAIVVMILALVNIIIYNLIAICLFKWDKYIRLYKKIGASMNIILFSMAEIIGLFLLIGYIIGFLISVVCCNIIYINVANVFVCIPLAELGIVLLVQILVIVYYFGCKYEKYANDSCENLENILTRKTIKEGNVKSILNSKIPLIRLSIRNFIYYGKRKIYNILTIGISIGGLALLCVQFKELPNNIDNNNDFDYLVDVDSYDEISNYIDEKEYMALINSYDKLVKLCNENNIITYMTNYCVQDYTIQKKYLSKEYEESFKDNISDTLRWNSSEKNVELPLYVMGYSDGAIKEIFGNEFKLKNNECIFLSRNLNYDGKGGYKIRKMLGEQVELRTNYAIDGGFSKKKYTVVKQVDDLLSYPISNNDYLCVIIKIDDFNKNFNNNHISSFYLKNLSSSYVECIEHILKGNKYVRLTDMNKELHDEKFNVYKKRIMYGMCIVLFGLFTILNIGIQTMLDVKVRRGELELLHIIGISKRKQRIIIILENMYIYVLGGGIGVFVCICIDKFMQEYCIIKESMITNIFMFLVLVYCIIITFLGLLLINRILNKD